MLRKDDCGRQSWHLLQRSVLISSFTFIALALGATARGDDETTAAPNAAPSADATSPATSRTHGLSLEHVPADAMIVVAGRPDALLERLDIGKFAVNLTNNETTNPILQHLPVRLDDIEQVTVIMRRPHALKSECGVKQ